MTDISISTVSRESFRHVSGVLVVCDTLTVHVLGVTTPSYLYGVVGVSPGVLKDDQLVRDVGKVGATADEFYKDFK